MSLTIILQLVKRRIIQKIKDQDCEIFSMLCFQCHGKILHFAPNESVILEMDVLFSVLKQKLVLNSRENVSAILLMG